MEQEVIEYARLRVRVPLDGEVRTVKNVRINKTLCKIIIEEETTSFSTCACGHLCKWKETIGRESVVGSEEKFREDFFESEGSNYGDDCDMKGNTGEDTSVKFPTEGDREARGGACTGDSSEGKVSRHEESFMNIEQHVGSLKKEGLGRAFFEGESMQQEVNTKVTETTTTHARGMSVQQEVFVLSEDDMATLHNEVELGACGGEGIIITENKKDAEIDSWRGGDLLQMRATVIGARE
ncbi:hypothetical protein VNO80_06535 [Phaseolus coccineus]|uniref:Uncharacterized protein n=1 Tax=Phaseolus coccineus TaxID=3886 RepID=A0AAN9NHX0_PHACN